MWLILGAVYGFFAVAGGAFAAHALKDHLTPDRLSTFELGIRYQMYHALALLLLAAMRERIRPAAANLTGWSFVLGTFIFCGSLYAVALTGDRWWAAFAPFGGIAILVGWAALVVGAIKQGKRR